MALVRDAQEVVDSLFAQAVTENLLTSTEFRRGRFGIIFAVFASEVTIWENMLAIIRNEAFLPTAIESENIEKLAAPMRFRARATSYQTNLTFYWTLPFANRTEDIVISIGQIAESADINPVQYVTTKEMTLYKEQEYVVIPAQSRLAGKDYYAAPDTLIKLIPGTNGISVTNIEESWGGRDQERDEELRMNALIARFALEKGTRAALERVLMERGLEAYDYNLIENLYGYGNFACYIDTTVDEFVDSVARLLYTEKAAGIYLVCDKATPLSLDLDVTIKVAQASDLLPTERKNLKNELRQTFDDYININGVGKKIMMTRAIHYIYEQLLSKYEMYDLHIEPTNLLSQVDEDNNILLSEYEVAKLNTMNIEIITELD